MKERIKRIGVVLLALCLLLTTLHVAVLAEDALPDIAYSASGYSGTYDDAAHSIAVSVSTEGATVLYAGPSDTGYGSTNPSFSDPGEYTVRYQITADGYNPVEGSETVKITEAEIDYEVTYLEVDYDGQAHAAGLNVLTDGVTISYSMEENGTYSSTEPTFTNPGSYMVYFRLEKHGYTTETGSAELVIRAIDISDEVEATLPDSFAYTGEPVHFDLPTDKIKEWSVEYWLGDGNLPGPPSEPDDKYYLRASGESDVYCAYVFHKFSIVEYADVIDYTVSGYSGAYDGAAHTIALSVATQDASVTYATSKEGEFSAELPTFTLPGEYTVWFMIEKADCETVLDSEAVTITPGVIDYSASGYSGAYDGEAHTIALSVATPDASVTYATSEGGEYSTDKPSFSEVGTHTVWYRIEKEYYATVEGSEVVKLQQPKQDSIVYSAEGYSGVYDGEAHTIALDVTTPNVNVAYATSRDGEYGATLPSFTEPGTHTVWFRLKKSGYETSTGSATVTIEKAEQVLYFEQSVKTILPPKDSEEIPFVSHCLCHDQGDGALSWSFSDPDRMSLRSGNLFWGTVSIDVPYAEWSKGYSATVTATAAETDHYKAATATLTIVAISSIQAEYSASSGSGSAADVMFYMSKQQVTNQMQETIQMQDIDLTVSPVSTLDNQSLLSASDELRTKLMASAGAGQIGSMPVDVALTDRQTGAELHGTNGDLTFSLTGDLQRKYQENYKEMSCVAVHIKQDSTNDPTAAPQGTTSDGVGASSGSSGFVMDGGTIDTSGANADGSGVYAGSSGFVMDGGNIDTATTGNSNNSLIGNTGNGIGGGNSGDGSNIQISSGNVSADGNTGNGIGGGNSGEGSNIQISGGSVKGNAGTSAPRPNDPAEDPTGTQVYKTEVNLDVNNGLNSTGNDSELNESYLRIQEGLRYNAGLGDGSSASSNEGQLLVQRGDLTVVPTGSLSPTVEYIPCKLTENGVIVSDTSLSPFLLIYGPKEAFSNLLTVRAKDGVFTYDGEGHAVAAEPSIAEGTTLYYSLDLETWQTEAPSFTDVRWNEDGSVGSYQVYVLADNPNCDPAVCSYLVTILPES